MVLSIGFYVAGFLCYTLLRMEEQPVHFYNVITGQCACGAEARRAEMTFTVFPELVTCTHCLSKLTPKEGKSEGKSGGQK